MILILEIWNGLNMFLHFVKQYCIGFSSNHICEFFLNIFSKISANVLCGFFWLCHTGARRYDNRIWGVVLTSFCVMYIYMCAWGTSTTLTARQYPTYILTYFRRTTTIGQLFLLLWQFWEHACECHHYRVSCLSLYRRRYIVLCVCVCVG